MLYLKQICIILFLLYAENVSSYAMDEIFLMAQDYPKHAFEKYIIKYNKSYTNRSSEYNKRFSKFLDTCVAYLSFHAVILAKEKASIRRINVKNLQYVSNHTNALVKDTAVYGINQFSDLSPLEFQEKYLSMIPTNRSQNSARFNGSRLFISKDLPKLVDWRTKGIVTPVGNQGQCGSCWAFSAIETLESMWALSGHKLVELSKQQVLDCSQGTYGCKGGSPYAAFYWMKKNHVKIVESSTYPYHAKQGKCIDESSAHFGVGVSDIFCSQCWSSCSEVEMSQLLPTVANVGPVSVIVDASSWQDYFTGIIQHHCSSNHPNHAVQIVGYDIKGDIPYWIVRNSWGRDFGDEGYLYIKIGDNVCGIANSYSGVSSTKRFP